VSRVAVIGPTHPYKGGIAQHTTQLAHRLAEAGYGVELVSWSEQYPQRLYPGEQRVADSTRPEMPVFDQTSYPLSWRRPDSWVRTGRRLRTAADWVVLVLVSPVQVPAYLVLLRALGHTVPVVVLCHNVLPHEPRSVDKPLVRAVLRRADGVLVHTASEQELAREVLDRPLEPVAVAAMAPFFQGSAGDGADAGQEADDVRHRLLFFGLVRHYKGLDVLIDALAMGPPEVSLTIAGEFWSPVEEFQARVDAHGLSDRVEIRPGYVPADEVSELFSSVDALVLPYRSGTASQHVELAFAHGLPVVATQVGSLADAVRHEVDGLEVVPGDAEALATALHRLYEPGVLATLRAGVHPISADPVWAEYIETLARLAGASATG
jgi:D-inositol-3-phosphate glycosyltransferase